MGAITGFLNSKRGLLVLLVVILTWVLVLTGHIIAERWLEFVQVAFTIYIPAETVSTIATSYIAGKNVRAPAEADIARSNAAAAVASSAPVSAPTIVNVGAPNPNGFAARGLLAAIAAFALVFGATLQVGCGPKTRQLVGDVIDCTTPTAKKLVTEFSPVLDQVLVRATTGDGSIDWASVKDATKSFGVETGGCVLSSVIARALKPATDHGGSSPVQASAEDLRRGFEEIRATQLGNKRFRTEAGEL